MSIFYIKNYLNLSEKMFHTKKVDEIAIIRVTFCDITLIFVELNLSINDAQFSYEHDI